jgi:hypothetical protein
MHPHAHPRRPRPLGSFSVLPASLCPIHHDITARHRRPGRAVPGAAAPPALRFATTAVSADADVAPAVMGACGPAASTRSGCCCPGCTGAERGGRNPRHPDPCWFHATRPPSCCSQISSEQVHHENDDGCDACRMCQPSGFRLPCGLCSLSMFLMSTQQTKWCDASSGKQCCVNRCDRSSVPQAGFWAREAIGAAARTSKVRSGAERVRGTIGAGVQVGEWHRVWTCLGVS